MPLCGPGLPSRPVNWPCGLVHHDRTGRHVPQRQLRLGADVHRTLGDHHVRPEVAIAPGAPAVPAQVQEAGQLAALLPAGQRGVRERGVLDAADLGYPQPGRRGQAAAGEGSQALGGPPAAVERRSRDDADHRAVAALAALHQRDQRRPDRHPADVVLGAVDRVDDPAARSRALAAELLAEHRVPWPGPLELAADELFGGLVRLAHRRHVRFGLDLEVECLEALHGGGVRGVREHMAETKIIVIVGHV